jgi:putative membrane protein
MFLGIFPPLICCIGDLIIGIQCLNPAAFIFAGLVAGLVYVNLIYAFAQAFRYIGKGLVVLFLIIQIPGSSGLYPIEMMPAFYQALHPLLPFTYTIDAFREAIGGFYGMDYWIDLLILVLVFVPIGLFVGLVLGKWASNLTLLLDREIGRTGLFDGEQTPQEIKLRLSTLLRALLHSPEYRADLSQRVARFEARFPKLRAIGWFALVAQFLITFAIMILLQADVDTKLFLLMAMVAGIVVVDTYLIVIVYMKTSLSSQLSLVHLSKGELAEQTGKRVTMRSPQPLATEAGEEDDRS